MKTFTIDNETNKISFHASAQEAEAVLNGELFSSETGLAMLAADWSGARLIEIWNSLPGETPVKKFRDRATAVSRIWKALQSLGAVEGSSTEIVPPVTVVSESPEPATAAHLAPQTPQVAIDSAPAPDKATPANQAPADPAKNRAPREGSKTSQVIAMLQREGGTTLEEIMAATGWQKHTTRAMLSAGGSLTKKHGLVVTSTRTGAQRTYLLRA